MNYATLSQAISDWLNKDSINAVLPLIIKFGQLDLEDNLRIRPMEYFPTPDTLSAGASTIAVPADYIEFIYLTLIRNNTRYPVDLRVDIKEMHRVATDTTDTGTPKAMSRVGEIFLLDVVTDVDYTKELGYYRNLTPLSPTAPNNINWWSENAEEALLMSCLNKASLYVSGIPEGDKKKWEKAADAARDRLILKDSKESTSGGIMRSRRWSL